MPEDIRSQRLLWIRDGSNWLVGFAAGGLVLSGTYFFERFNRAPNWRFALIVAWCALAVSILAGVLTSFSSWKDLKKPDGDIEVGLGGWVTHSYTVMMWAFVIGYGALAFCLIANTASLSAGRGDVIKIEVPNQTATYTINVNKQTSATNTTRHP